MDVAEPWNIDLVLFATREFASFSVFIFGIFLFPIFNRRWCYIFIIPITDSDHLQQSYFVIVRSQTACLELKWESDWGTLVHTLPGCFFREHSLFHICSVWIFSFIGNCKTKQQNTKKTKHNWAWGVIVMKPKVKFGMSVFCEFVNIWITVKLL